MAARALRRLLRVFVLEEEQAQGALEAGIANQRHLEVLLEAAVEKRRAGQRLFLASAHKHDTIDRLDALEEVEAARRAVAALRPRIVQAEIETCQRREEFLAKRVERRQAETLIRETDARTAVETARRTQQSMDERHLRRISQISREGRAEVRCGPQISSDSIGTSRF